MYDGLARTRHWSQRRSLFFYRVRTRSTVASSWTKQSAGLVGRGIALVPPEHCSGRAQRNIGRLLPGRSPSNNVLVDNESALVDPDRHSGEQCPDPVRANRSSRQEQHAGPIRMMFCSATPFAQPGRMGETKATLGVPPSGVECGVPPGRNGAPCPPSR